MVYGCRARCLDTFQGFGIGIDTFASMEILICIFTIVLCAPLRKESSRDQANSKVEVRATRGSTATATASLL